MLPSLQITEAIEALRLGQVIAYPTEAVYGLGCNPFDAQAVAKLLALKGRDSSKGLILLIAEWAQLYALIGDLPLSALDNVIESWPGHTTWIFPKSTRIPTWLSGEHDSIAIRMTAHPVAKQLCQMNPLVSTSANRQGDEPIRSRAVLEQAFLQGLAGVVNGELGAEKQPSAIYDVLSGQRLR